MYQAWLFVHILFSSPQKVATLSIGVLGLWHKQSTIYPLYNLHGQSHNLYYRTSSIMWSQGLQCYKNWLIVPINIYIYIGSLHGIPVILNLRHSRKSYSVHCFIAQYFKLNKLVSILDCFLLNQYIWAIFTYTKNPILDLRVIVFPAWSASTNACMKNPKPPISGIFVGNSYSSSFPYGIASQSFLSKTFLSTSRYLRLKQSDYYADFLDRKSVT